MENVHPQLRAMHGNEERRYRDKIGEKAWAFLNDIEAEYGNAAMLRAARLLDAEMEKHNIRFDGKTL